jgi:hypothetical protein
VDKPIKPERVYPGDVLGCRSGARLLILVAFVIIVLVIIWLFLLPKHLY